MSCKNTPAIHIKDGDTITLHTYDCFKEKLVSADQDTHDYFSELNPATGPVFVEGAQKGDTLKVEILKISLADQGVTETDGDFGCLSHLLKKPEIRFLPLSQGKLRFREDLHLAVEPMIGVIGVAPPEGKSIPTDTPDTHGGNMDCKEITEGASIYFPVYTKGALLALGDLHACMGDGEIGGCGAEISGEVTVKVSVLPGVFHPYPVVITPEKVMVIASKPTVEEAWKEAAALFHQYLMSATRLTAEETVLLLSLAADLSICQTVNPNKTVRMSIKKQYLKNCGFQEK